MDRVMRRIRHVVSHLIREQRIDPKRILYFSLDEPEVYGSSDAQRVIIDLLVERMRATGKPGYLFLDEVQRLPKWEQATHPEDAVPSRRPAIADALPKCLRNKPLRARLSGSTGRLIVPCSPGSTRDRVQANHES